MPRESGIGQTGMNSGMNTGMGAIKDGINGGFQPQV